MEVRNVASPPRLIIDPNFTYRWSGWNAPRNSTALVYPQGLNQAASDDELNVSFEPSPNYAKMAEAAAGLKDGWMHGERAKTVEEMRERLTDAVDRVRAGQGCLLEALMEK
jgi:hypothetical protein